MYLQQHQQHHHHHHPPNCQHQQQMDDYNCNDGQFTSYNNNNIIPRQINNRVHHPSHHAYNDTGYYGTYPHHTHLTHPVLLTTDSELSRLSSSSSSLHWTKAPSGHDFPPPPPPSSSTPGSLVFYGGQDVGGGGGGQDWTGAAAQDHDFLQCKDPGVLVACHQLSSPDDHLTHGGGGPAGGLRRTLASVADGCGAASTGGGGGGGGCPGDVSGGSTSTFLSHQQQSLRSASSLTTNRHSLGTSPSARNLTTLQPGYAPHHHHHHQQQLRSLCGSAGAGLSLSARSPTGHSDLSTAILGRRSEDQLPRGALGSAGGGGGGRGEGQGAAVGRSANHNQVPFDWMKKQIYPITPTSGKTRTKDKYRIVYSEHQKVELEKEFLYNPYITIQRKAELATIIGLSDRQVKIWFQNRRAKERKQKKKRPQTTTTTAAAAAKAANHVTTNALEPGVETAATGGARSLYHHPHHLPVDHHNNHHHQQQQQQLGRHGGGGRLVAVGGSGDVKMEGGCRVSGLAESVEDGARSNEVKSESVTNL